MGVITSIFKRSVSLRSIILTIFPPYFEGFTNLLKSVPSLNTTLSIMTTSDLEDTASEDYNSRNILKLAAQEPLLAEHMMHISSTSIFTKPQDFGIYWKAVSTSRKLWRPIFLATRERNSLHLLTLDLYCGVSHTKKHDLLLHELSGARRPCGCFV